MTYEKRRGEKAVPDNLKELLSDLQLMSLNKMKDFGWELLFIRRPLFQDVVPVVSDHDGIKIGIIEGDGRINLEPDIRLRET
ncbi:MAG: hypothetical protein ABW098_14745 [Candidatus Thiodiazotropha sp.]